MAEQRRGRSIAMTPEERDAFLGSERTCRVATVTAAGKPHVTPLWFVWHGDACWLYSIVRSQRWTDLARDPNVSVIVDGGQDYLELCGVELSGAVEVVGEVPRVGAPVPELEPVEHLFATKYHGVTPMTHDERHAWLRLVPAKIVSWDFKKLAGLSR